MVHAEDILRHERLLVVSMVIVVAGVCYMSPCVNIRYFAHSLFFARLTGDF
jgi:hypothetical protein